jgi:cytoskeletal protein RodZ
MTLGETLAAKRGERGLTIEQAAAATRIRAHYLSALGTGVATRDFSSQT